MPSESAKKFHIVLDADAGYPRLKHSIIFSDGVIPFGFNEEIAEILDQHPTLLPTFLLEKKGILRRYGVKNDAIALLSEARAKTSSMLVWRYDHDHGPGAFLDFWGVLSKVLFHWKLPRETPLLCSTLDGYAAAVSPRRIILEPGGLAKPDFNGFEFSGIPLIDTANLSWETVLAMRSDPNLRSKIRNFYLFYDANYSGSSRDFIEADLISKYEEYQNAIKDWGFETLTGSLSMVLGTGAFAGVAGSLIASIAGVEALSIASLPLLGAAAGHTGIHVAKRSYERNKINRDSPIRLLIDYPSVIGSTLSR